MAIFTRMRQYLLLILVFISLIDNDINLLSFICVLFVVLTRNVYVGHLSTPELFYLYILIKVWDTNLF